MDFWSSILVALLLMAISAGLTVRHVQVWRAALAVPSETVERDFSRRQFRRRMQTSAMLGVVGVSMLVGQVLTAWIGSGLFAALYLCAVLLLLIWLVLLALADILATRFHYGRLRRDYLIEQAKLRAEIHQIQEVEGNGEAKRHA